MPFDDSFKEIMKKRVSKVVKRVRKRARAARAARVLSLWKCLRERSYRKYTGRTGRTGPLSDPFDHFRDPLFLDFLETVIKSHQNPRTKMTSKMTHLANSLAFWRSPPLAISSLARYHSARPPASEAPQRQERKTGRRRHGTCHPWARTP